MPRNEMIQSLLRAVDVIELVAQSERGLSLGEVCNALGLKQPTAHNLIRTLVARDFVEKTTSPVRYRLGAAVTRLANERHNQEVVRRAEVVIRDLFERMKVMLPDRLEPQDEASISFSEHINGEVVMVLRLRLQRPGVMERPRHVMNAYGSASPLCFQAHWPPEEREQYAARHPFLEQGAAIWKSQEKLDQFLARVRELGYVHMPHSSQSGFRAAVPVWGDGHRLLGVLGAGVWLKSVPTTARRMIKQMLEASERIGKPA